jgi:hypothetical protein
MNRAKPVLMTVSGLLAMRAAFASVSGAEFAANSGAPEIYAPLPANELDALVAPMVNRRGDRRARLAPDSSKELPGSGERLAEHQDRFDGDTSRAPAGTGPLAVHFWQHLIFR